MSDRKLLVFSFSVVKSAGIHFSEDLEISTSPAQVEQGPFHIQKSVELSWTTSTSRWFVSSLEIIQT